MCNAKCETTLGLNNAHAREQPHSLDCTLEVRELSDTSAALMELPRTEIVRNNLTRRTPTFTPCVAISLMRIHM